MGFSTKLNNNELLLKWKFKCFSGKYGTVVSIHTETRDSTS